MDELVKIILNHQGTDVEINVDLETANILLNDPSQAEAYLANLLSEERGNEEIENEEMQNEESQELDDHMNVIWTSKGKPTARDIQATEYFLQLRQRYAPQFDDKKTCKAKLWQKIATNLKAAGFNVGIGAAEKCRQKFQNLLKLYLKHKQYVKRTGTGKKEPPHYYDLMHSIMGGKHKVDPQHLQDSFDFDTNEGTNEDNNNVRPVMPTSDVDEPSTSSAQQNPKNRFQNTKKITKPKSTNELLLDFFKKDSEENKADRAKQFKLLEKLVDTHCQQQEKLLQMLLLKKRKRSDRGSDSSDSDDS